MKLKTPHLLPLRGISLILALVPLALKGSYLFNAWRWSKLDAFGPVYVALALFVGGGIAWLNREKPAALSPLGALLALAGFAGCAFFSLVQPLNFPYLICAIAVWAGWVWAAFGWGWCWRLLPAWALLAISLPQVTFTLNHNLEQFSFLPGGTWLQALAALGALAVTLPVALLLPAPPVRAVFFAGLLGVCGAGLALRAQPVQTGVPVFLTVEDLRRGSWEGRYYPLTEFDKNFFGDNEAFRVGYTKGRDVSVGLLAVRLRGSIYQIHRPDVCLRSGGYAINSYETTLFPLGGGTSLAAVMMDVTRPGDHSLVLYWFTCPEYSIGNYMAFRWRWSQGGNWWSYLAQTPIHNNDRATAEKTLREFVHALQKAP